jgi:hypothetical protein
MMDGATVAVITGDVVGSARFGGGARTQLHEGLRATASDLATAFGEVVPYPVAFFRGDSWQLLVSNPSVAVRVGLYFRSAARALFEATTFDVRMAIGVGTVSFLPERDVSAGDGEAFRRSGEALDGLAGDRRLVLVASPAMRPVETGAIDAIVGLIDSIASGWTARQARAVTGALLDWTQAEIAGRRFDPPITQQGVAQHLDRAAWDAVERALRFLEGDRIQWNRSTPN